MIFIHDNYIYPTLFTLTWKVYVNGMFHTYMYMYDIQCNHFHAKFITVHVVPIK